MVIFHSYVSHYQRVSQKSVAPRRWSIDLWFQHEFMESLISTLTGFSLLVSCSFCPLFVQFLCPTKKVQESLHYELNTWKLMEFWPLFWDPKWSTFFASMGKAPGISGANQIRLEHQQHWRTRRKAAQWQWKIHENPAFFFRWFSDETRNVFWRFPSATFDDRRDIIWSLYIYIYIYPLVN